MHDVLRSIWREPAAPDPPARVWRDWVLVGCLIPIALVEGLFTPDVVWRPFATMLAIALTPTLLWRRTRPFATAMVVFGAFVAVDVARLVAGVDKVGLATTAYSIVLIYSLVRWGSGRHILLGMPVILVAAGLAVAFDYTGVGDAIGGFSVLGLIMASGAVVRYHRKERAQAIEDVRVRERERIARDLHDTVAHHVSAIVVQAQAGLATAPTRPEAATEALSLIEAEAGRTLAEMRTMVGLLRRNDGVDLAPLPTIADIAHLAETGGNGAGPARPTVSIRLAGDLSDVSPTVATAVYRMTQESITNARRHARNAGRIDVSVSVDAQQVHLEVCDDGDTGTASPTPGFGLVGMTERAGLLGGTCTAGPRAGSGWVVRATLPARGAGT